MIENRLIIAFCLRIILSYYVCFYLKTCLWVINSNLHTNTTH